MPLPVGYIDFHKNPFLNYQFNRLYSTGFSREQDLRKAAKWIKGPEDCAPIMFYFAEEAKKEKRLRNAAFYLRGAEFFIEPGNPKKQEVYEDFLKTFDKAFWLAGFIRHEVPYKNGKLPVLYFPSQTSAPKGTIVCFGGFDSLIEEFYCIWDGLSRSGYNVYAFDGPGQGGALRLHQLPFEHDWEGPVGAVLDHFKVNRTAIMGVSMGGYWAVRAAAFEKRIHRVIAMPPVYDWMELAGSFSTKLVAWLRKFPGLMDFLVRIKMSVPLLRHAVKQANFISGTSKPHEAVDWMMGMNKDHLHSGSVSQSCLLLGGENDAFQPPKLLQAQASALIHARSVTTRIFTKEEHADQHCQIGNLGLAIKEIISWLDTGKVGN
ncbi:MAG: alpha/beta fold hydrolase [Saprospiraceae bacterium]|nr:alpha/beta fold hydrolase [Saprospiraceae bacterium]